ncbi:MAG TPA: hypothetical protein ENN29_02070 [Candidatus Hydrogenedentes bacterium]|nr:hypothetical protein [Candidatus Hydrogenedentota bacterium]
MNDKYRIQVHLSVVMVIAAGITACRTGPDYERPKLDMPDRYKSAGGEAMQQEMDREWWRLFGDPELDRLCQAALDGNPGLEAAMARVEQSRASASYVKSAFYPVITGGASANRSEIPVQTMSSDSDTLSEISSSLGQVTSLLSAVNTLAQGQIPSLGSTGVSQSTTLGTGASSNISNSFRIPFDLSYEIDLWGRSQRSYEKAQAEMQARVYDYEVARQTLLADIARSYFNLRLLDTQKQILNQNLALYTEQAQLTRQQYEAGLVNETNALQAEIQLETTRTQAISTERQRGTDPHFKRTIRGASHQRATCRNRAAHQGNRRWMA